MLDSTRFLLHAFLALPPTARHLHADFARQRKQQATPSAFIDRRSGDNVPFGMASTVAAMWDREEHEPVMDDLEIKADEQTLIDGHELLHIPVKVLYNNSSTANSLGGFHNPSRISFISKFRSRKYDLEKESDSFQNVSFYNKVNTDRSDENLFHLIEDAFTRLYVPLHADLCPDCG